MSSHEEISSPASAGKCTECADDKCKQFENPDPKQTICLTVIDSTTGELCLHQLNKHEPF